MLAVCVCVCVCLWYVVCVIIDRLCRGDHRGQWALNDTRDWADLGTLHPRMKKPLGKRLAQGLFATAYNGSMPVSGPVSLAGLLWRRTRGLHSE